MIEIILYNNGFEVKGHAKPVVCSEVSILAWAYANDIYEVDETSKWRDSKAEGYTAMTFDTANEMAVWLFNRYKHNLRVWAKDMWEQAEVYIRELDAILMI